MKRAIVTLASACLVLFVGCRPYEDRLAKTLEEMRYQKRLDDNLMPPATKAKLEELQIYIRPPKNLKGPTQTFAMTVVEPGRFDLENSFIDEAKLESLHVLVRIKRPKAPAKTKKGAAAADAPVRGEFTADVLELIKNVYGEDLTGKKPKSDVKSHGNRSNTYRTWTMDLTAKEVQIYLYGDKNAPYEVALIFDYPKDSKASIDPKIRLSLEAFAVGEAARSSFNSGADSEGGGEEGGGSPPPV